MYIASVQTQIHSWSNPNLEATEDPECSHKPHSSTSHGSLAVGWWPAGDLGGQRPAKLGSRRKAAQSHSVCKVSGHRPRHGRQSAPSFPAPSGKVLLQVVKFFLLPSWVFQGKGQEKRSVPALVSGLASSQRAKDS